MVVWIRPPTCGLPVAILELVVYRDPTGCLTAFYFSPFEVRDDSNPSGDGLPHLSRIKLGGAATIAPGGGERDCRLPCLVCRCRHSPAVSTLWPTPPCTFHPWHHSLPCPIQSCGESC